MDDVLKTLSDRKQCDAIIVDLTLHEKWIFMFFMAA